MAFFNSNVDSILRNDLDRTYADMAFGENYAKLIGLFKKEDRSGDAVKVPVKDDVGAGMGGSASTAYTNASLASRYAFTVTPFKAYGISNVPLDQAVFANGDDNAVADLLMDEAKTAMDSCKKQFDQFLASDGSGTIFTAGTCTNTSGSTWTIVLTKQSDMNNVVVNSTLVSKATAFAASLDTGSYTVTGKTAYNKTITVTANGGSTPTATHVFGVQGTMLASTALATIAGIPAWIPPTASRPVSSTTFFGQDRSVDEQKLAGSALDGTDKSILEGINQLAYMVANVPGAHPDTIVCSFATLGKINSDLQTAAIYEQIAAKGVPDVFYKLPQINGPKGSMSIVASASWPDDLVAVLSSDSWVLGAPGNKPFQPATSNGLPFIEVATDDVAVTRYRGAAFVYCTAPGHNGMLTIRA